MRLHLPSLIATLLVGALCARVGMLEATDRINELLDNALRRSWSGR